MQFYIMHFVDSTTQSQTVNFLTIMCKQNKILDDANHSTNDAENNKPEAFLGRTLAFHYRAAMELAVMCIFDFTYMLKDLSIYTALT